MWEKTAIEIAEQAFEECDNKRIDALEFIHESVDGCEDVIYTLQAYDTVIDARTTAPEYFDRGHERLVETEGDRIRQDETIDDVITRLAYWIILERAVDHYETLIA